MLIKMIELFSIIIWKFSLRKLNKVQYANSTTRRNKKILIKKLYQEKLNRRLQRQKINLFHKQIRQNNNRIVTMSFAPQGQGKQSGISQAYQSGDRARIDQMNIALLGLGGANNVQSPNQNNNLNLYGSPSQNLLQSTSSVGYSGNVDQYQNQYITQLNNQNSHHSGVVASSAISYSSKNYNYVDYGNIGAQNPSQNAIPSNNYSNQGYQRSYENMTPLSQASNQANFNQAISTAPAQQTATYSGHNIGVQQINLTNNTASINLAGQFDREQKEKKERDQLIQQIRDSQQIKSKAQQEENDAARGQLLLMEEMKRQLQEQEKEKQRQLKQQQEQEAVTQAQLKQYEDLKRQTQREKEAKLKQQKEQELQQKKLQQQQQQQQLQEEQEEKKKRSKMQQQQEQLQQQQIDLEEQKRQQREQEEILQRQYEQQKQQEEYYQQQLEIQQNKIMEQNQMLEQMKQALSQNQQNTKQSTSREPPSSVKRAHNHKTSSGNKDKSNINTVNQLDANLERRLEIIETSLNRVCNQHDALMPLLQLLETVPSLQRSEQQVKNLSKKYSDVEKRLKEIESSEKKDSQYQHIFSNIDRNFKNTANQISQLKKEISTLENNIQQIQSIPEAKLKEDTLHLYRQVDAKLDRNMRDVKSLLADFKNQVQLNMKRGEIVHSHSQERTIKPRQQQQDDGGEGGEEMGQSPVRIYNDLNNRIDSQMNAINGQLASHQRYLSTQSTTSKQQIDIDIANIYREIGMLRSEMELLINKARNEFIHEQLSNISNPTEIEKQLFIAGLEQNLFLQEIESFDQINFNRVFNELELLEDKLQLLNTDILQMQDHNTMYNNVNQIHEVDSERAETTSQHLLIDQYRDQEGIGSNGGQNFKQNPNITNIDVVGYELKFIGDRIFSYKQQTHGTKKKYLCDSRRLEDRLQTLEYLSTKAEEEGTDNQVIQQICQIDKFKERVDSINNSIGTHVSSLNDKLKQVEESFNKTKNTFKKAKGVFSSP
ncbi:hypothetical protein ABPG72_015458 [Tetrahymena utriculariae]